MKLLKSAVIALSLALSLGSFSTTAVACTDGRTCVGNENAIEMIGEHIKQAITSVDDHSDVATILEHIRQAKNLSKEINANDVVDRNRMKANGKLKKARKLIKSGEMSEGKALLEEAAKRYKALKGML